MSAVDEQARGAPGAVQPVADTAAATPEGPQPALSVILITPGRYATLRHTVRSLRAQTVAHRLELVIVAPRASDLGVIADELQAFACWQVVEIGAFDSTAQARAAGVRRALAPVVAFAEDHAFPEPAWAAALLAAHAAGWAAVGPVVVNANPWSVSSWAAMLVEYLPWLEPAAAGPVDQLPGHNSSFKRELLVSYGERLADLLEAELVLHYDLRARGHTLYLEPAARLRHVNFSAPLAWLPLRLHSGRAFAAWRARNWSPARRALYVAGAPLIPLVRLWRIVRRLRASGDPQRLLPRVLPLLALMLLVDGAGELLGYLFGAGDAATRVSAMEFHRGRFLTAADRRALAQSGADGR